MPRSLTCLLIGLLLAASADPAGAAAPGGEPAHVTPHFRFHPVDGTEQNTARLAAVAESRYDRLCRMLDACELSGGPVDVYVARDATGFAAAFGSRSDSPMAEWAVGVAFLRDRRIVLRGYGSALFTLQETFDHEVSHIIVHDAAGPGRVPRWFSEGVAIWQAGEPVLERLVQAQRAAIADRLVPLAELDRQFPDKGAAVSLAYAEAALFVRWLERSHGFDSLPRLFARMRSGASFDDAFVAIFEAPLATLDEAWRDGLEGESNVVLLFGDPNLLWGVMSLLFLVVAVARYRQQKAQLAAMADDELAAADLTPEEPVDVFH